MPLTHDLPQRRGSSMGGLGASVLEDRFELLKEIGDGSFGSVALARVRTAGAQVARRGTLVAIKTMKKTFESFSPCLELREIIFLRSVPTHPHLVPSLDIFLDPLSKKLHICMENMDGNLYQLMKSRDHKSLDTASVKSILYQILSGLSHIHAHQFFHRDIKPENILVSTSAPTDTANTFRRYSAMITPPSTPPSYTVKIADFGLARETNSPHPFTTYVSTRWYRAPEVLLRAGHYSAPVDIWALGAMAVEIANLKPLFPGGNEVDQVWRVCEIMGSPGNWYDKHGRSVGGGDWRDGTRLAQKLGFSFPKMAPHSMESILRPPQWPREFSNFVTWCLMWDPRNRPTSVDAMQHPYFADAVDPLRPKSSTSRILNKKHMSVDGKAQRESADGSATVSKPSWLRKSLIRESSAPVQTLDQTAEQAPAPRPASPRLAPVQHTRVEAAPELSHNRFRPFATKRATWANMTTKPSAAPMPILPTIRPISPFRTNVNAEASSKTAIVKAQPAQPAQHPSIDSKPSKKIGRQLSIQSQNNHYADRYEAEQALNGQRNPQSPSAEQRGFFAHLRKRARRFSGKPNGVMPAAGDDEDVNPGCSPWHSNRNSMIVDSNMDSIVKKDFNDIDQALQTASYGNAPLSPALERHASNHALPSVSAIDLTPQRHPSLSKSASTSALDTAMTSSGPGAPISSRTRRALQRSTQPNQIYDAPDEEDELLIEALHNAQTMTRNMERRSRIEDEYYQQSRPRVTIDAQMMQTSPSHHVSLNPYPTPSPTAKRNGVLFDHSMMSEPATSLNLSNNRTKEPVNHRWPTPPYEENEWAASAAASIFAAGSNYK